MRIWYEKEGRKFLDGLPIGNGRQGAVLLGGTNGETITLNNDSLWYGGFRDRVNPDAKKNLPVIRQLVFDGKIKEAEELAFTSLTAVAEGERTYEQLAEFKTILEHHIGTENYYRGLDLDTATVTTSYDYDGVHYTREAFASYPNQVIAMKWTADKANGLTFRSHLFRKYADYNEKVGDNTILLGGQSGSNGVDYCVGVKAFVKDGTAEVIGKHLVVKDATEVIFYIYSTTSFYDDDAKQCVIDKLASLTAENYDSIYAEHLKDYQTIYKRLDISLGSEEQAQIQDKIPTDERVKAIQGGFQDDSFTSLFYQYGRYLQIESSRVGSLPMNLVGIWNDQFLPPWDSKFTININQEMLYWPTDMCNMSECGQPLYDLIERMKHNGKKVAQDMYGCRGFVAHHNTDLWADCAPQDIHRAAFWYLGAAWMVLHLWDSYDYNRDEEFLATAYDTIKEAVRFVLDVMVEDKDGYLVTCPSHSPENGYLDPSKEKRTVVAITYAPTMDNMIINYLFRRFIEIDDILGFNESIVDEVKVAKERLHKPSVGKYGQLMEWVEDFTEAEPGHRHVAHMFALHPADDIGPFKTPELMQACENTITRRLAHIGKADMKNGWTTAWWMLFQCRMLHKDEAYSYLLNMYQNGIATNLFGLCVTDEIYVLDGNLGIVAAVTELLFQSQNEELFLLPTLPDQWSEGHLNGVKGRGGFEVSLAWNEHKLTEATITSITDTVCTIRSYDDIKVVGKENCVWENGLLKVAMAKGETITVVRR